MLSSNLACGAKSEGRVFESLHEDQTGSTSRIALLASKKAILQGGNLVVVNKRVSSGILKTQTVYNKIAEI